LSTKSQHCEDRGASESSSALGKTESSKREWHRPTIHRIDVKRTLFGTGTHSDGITSTT
jgi:hypothetical protein